jgi:tRNA dimethylallyltransferase
LSLHQLLAAVDPQEAGRWHWRDGRKVKRGLERWWESSGSIEKTSEEVGGIKRKAKFRTLIFWVYEPMTTLRPRLDKRVDKMVEVITYFLLLKGLIRVDLIRMDY